MKHMRLTFSLLILTGMTLCSCYDPNAQTSAIVREVESAGSGNLDVSSLNGLVMFLSARPSLAKRIDQECEPLAERADAHWVETAEGRACLAAHRAAPPIEWQSDKRSF